MFVNKLTFHIDRCRLLVFISFSPLYIPISAFHFHNIFTKSHYSWSSLVTWVFVIITIHSIFARRKKNKKITKAKLPSTNQKFRSLCIHSLSPSHSLFLLRIQLHITKKWQKSNKKDLQPKWNRMKQNKTKNKTGI